MTRIFISYRRADSEYQADRLHAGLSEFTSDIFIDVRDIPLGRDFVSIIDERVGECGILLALIGKNWVSSADEAGNLRLTKDDDYVRLEISSALRRDIPVVPVLLDGTVLPKASDLPEDLRALVRRAGITLSRATFDYDVSRIVAGLGLSRQTSASAETAGNPAETGLACREMLPEKTEFFEVVGLYKKYGNGVAGLDGRRQTDRRTSLLAGKLSLEFLRQQLVHNPTLEAATAVAVLLGRSPENESFASAQLLASLLDSVFERVRFRAARSIERRSKEEQLTVSERQLFSAALNAATNKEQARVCRDAMVQAHRRVG